jgi:peptide/nickel transport system permease protein
MIKFLVRRLVGMIVTLAVVSFIIYLIMELPPGDYAERYAMQMRDAGMLFSEEEMIALKEQFGLNRPWLERYMEWVGNIITKGDFGISWNYRRLVTEVVGERLGYTIALALVSLVFTYILAIPIGIYSAVRQYTMGDYFFTVIGYLGLAIPNFLLALILLYISSMVFDVSVGGLFSPEFVDAPWSMARIRDFLSHLWIPAIVLAMGRTAFQMRSMRALMLDEVNKLYVTAARAQGLSEWRLLLKYSVRASLNPIISTLGWELTAIVSGAPIISLVLGLPDTGPLFLNALLDQDMNLGGALLLMLTFFTVLGTTLSDILLVILDPRLRSEGNL